MPHANFVKQGTQSCFFNLPFPWISAVLNSNQRLNEIESKLHLWVIGLFYVQCNRIPLMLRTISYRKLVFYSVLLKLSPKPFCMTPTESDEMLTRYDCQISIKLKNNNKTVKVSYVVVNLHL